MHVATHRSAPAACSPLATVQRPLRRALRREPGRRRLQRLRSGGGQRQIDQCAVQRAAVQRANVHRQLAAGFRHLRAPLRVPGWRHGARRRRRRGRRSARARRAVLPRRSLPRTELRGRHGVSATGSTPSLSAMPSARPLSPSSRGSARARPTARSSTRTATAASRRGRCICRRAESGTVRRATVTRNTEAIAIKMIFGSDGPRCALKGTMLAAPIPRRNAARRAAICARATPNARGAIRAPGSGCRR